MSAQNDTEMYETALLRADMTLSELLVASPFELARLRLTREEVEELIQRTAVDLAPPISRLDTKMDVINEIFTTGDELLDSLLGGGIRTGLVWELVGEGAAGKTQIALQLSLMAQLPRSLGGVSGSVCYLTTPGSALSTTRLVQILETHPRLAQPDENGADARDSPCSLAHVRTRMVDTPETLIHALGTMVPALIAAASQGSSHPLKLLVIDSLAFLFRANSDNAKLSMVERSKTIAEISRELHALVTEHNLAAVVINDTGDVFDNEYPTSLAISEEMLYRNQARWFSRTRENLGERKEASLGIVWANQVNARIMLTRTGRRRHVEENEVDTSKRRRTDGVALNGVGAQPTQSTSEERQAILIRRLAVLFSCAGPSRSIDYIITASGVSCVGNEVSYVPAAQVRGRPSPPTNDKRTGVEYELGIEAADAVPDRDPATDLEDDALYWADDQVNLDEMDPALFGET